MSTAGEPPYTAVVHVHGIGEQRRYEDLARLVDALEVGTHGRLTGVAARLEPPVEGAQRTTAHLTGTLATADGPVSLRFTEAYWAPLAAGSLTALRVLWWLLRSLPRPVAVLASPWATHPRLRRAHLLHLWTRRRTAGRGWDTEDLEALFAVYDVFAGPRGERSGGSDFASFLAAVAAAAPDPATAGRRQDLARAWRRHGLERETLAAIAPATVVLALGLLVGGLALTVGRLVLDPTSGAVALRVLAAAVLVVGLGAAGRFLGRYLGDVVLWTTYEETDERYRRRTAILRTAVEALDAALGDPACQRILVIGHSLGSSIALDALLDVGRRVRSGAAAPETPAALGKIDKIDTLISLGSPVDKVHHFFESSPDGTARYRRTVEQVRGDLGTEPFTRADGSTRIRWVNVWDRGDVISGSIETANARQRPDLRVDDVEVALRAFPSPGGSHLGYVADAGVVALLTRALEGPLPDGPFGPGAGLRRVVVLTWVALVTPWATTAGLALSLVDGLGWLRGVTLAVVGVAGVIVAGLSIAGAVAGPRRPLPGVRPGGGGS